VILGACVVVPGAVAAEKVFVHALEGEPESLDSAKATSERANRVTWLLGDALVNVSKDGKRLEPGLAQSWTLSPDGLQVVMKLRPGVAFHDGTALDARAARDSIERQFRRAHPLYGNDPKNSKEEILSNLIESIESQDGLTLALRLKYPGLHYLSQVEVASPTAVAKLGTGFGRSPVYTGPFRFESWSKSRIVLAANDKYWGGRPRVDRTLFPFVPEGKALVEGLLQRQVDFAPVLVDPVLYERAREDPGITLATVPGLNISYLGFCTERPPLNNPALRRAIVQGVNVQRAATLLGRGSAVTAKGPLAPAMLGYDPAVSQASHDPRTAKDLVSKAGIGNDLTLRLIHVSSKAIEAELAGVIQNDLRQIGIKVELIGKDGWPELVKAVRAREGDMFMYNWHVRAPYPERVLVPLFTSGAAGTTNLTQYTNPNLDRLLAEALRLPEGPGKANAYTQVQRMIIEDAPMMFLYHTTRMAAYTDRVQGLELNLGALPSDKLVKVNLAR
jgi:peptide/nickel transport system substrate-binding protein